MARLNNRSISLCFVIFSIAFASKAEPLPAPPKAPLTELSLKPAGCYIDDEQPDCEINIYVYWRRYGWPPFCLYVDDKTEPFYCGEGEQADAVTLTLKTAHTVAIIWRRQADQSEVDRIEFVVTTDQESRRNRRHHPWSIF